MLYLFPCHFSTLCFEINLYIISHRIDIIKMVLNNVIKASLFADDVFDLSKFCCLFYQIRWCGMVACSIYSRLKQYKNI